MAYVAKKVISRLVKSVPKYQKVLKLARDRDINESDTIEIITDMLADVFGYDKYLEVTSEYAIRGRYCDVALKVDDKVQFLIEAKAIGLDLKQTHLRQAIDYGANHGIQWIILTNGAEWRLYRLRFEKPINYDLVHSFDFCALDPRNKKDQQGVLLIAKEGLNKNAREDFYEKVQCVNRFVIASFILAPPVLKVIRREVRKFSDGVKVELQEVEQIVRSEVLRRNLVEGEDAQEAQTRVARLYKKASRNSRQKKRAQKTSSTPGKEGVSFSDQLLEESNQD